MWIRHACKAHRQFNFNHSTRLSALLTVRYNRRELSMEADYLTSKLFLMAWRSTRRDRPKLFHLSVRIVVGVLVQAVERAPTGGPVWQHRRHMHKERQSCIQGGARLLDDLTAEKVGLVDARHRLPRHLCRGLVGVRLVEVDSIHRGVV
jgi:hypothetical protein